MECAYAGVQRIRRINISTNRFNERLSLAFYVI